MRKYFFSSVVLLSLSTMITSCTKKGCIDSFAKNYDSSAKSSDGSCSYQGSVIIWADQTFAQAAFDAGITTWNFSISGSPVGSMATTTYFNSAPDCGTNGAVTIVKDLGSLSSKDFTVEVTDENGDLVATYTVTFKGGVCSNWKLN